MSEETLISRVREILRTHGPQYGRATILARLSLTGGAVTPKAVSNALFALRLNQEAYLEGGQWRLTAMGEASGGRRAGWADEGSPTGSAAPDAGLRASAQPTAPSPDQGRAGEGLGAEPPASRLPSQASMMSRFYARQLRNLQAELEADYPYPLMACALLDEVAGYLCGEVGHD